MQDSIKRWVIILVALALMVTVTGFLVFPQRMADFASELHRQEDNTRLGMVVAAVLINLLLAAVIYQEFGRRAYSPEGLLLRSRNAVVEVSLESVQTTLNHQVDKLEHVLETRTVATSRQGRVALQIEVDADEQSDLRKLTTQIKREVEKVVNKQMGLQLAAKPLIRYNVGDQFGITPESLEQKAALPSSEVGVLSSTPRYESIKSEDDIDLTPLAADDEPVVFSSSTPQD